VNFNLAANAVSRLCQPAIAARKAMVRRSQNACLRDEEYRSFCHCQAWKQTAAQWPERGPASPIHHGPHPTADHPSFLGLVAQLDSPADLGTNHKRSILPPHKVIWEFSG
jgi:hypothetical protein